MKKFFERVLPRTKMNKVNLSNTTESYIHKDAHDNMSVNYSLISPDSVSRKERLRWFLFLLFLFSCSLISMLLKANAMKQRDVQPGIAQEIIRFHVIANSDSKEDQELKILVKNTLVSSLSPLLSDVTSKEEAISVLSRQMDAMKALAEETIQANGYSYNVNVTMANVYFPLKIYGNYTFPPGYYDALRVQIGNAQGKNWWCVMFPPLCFVDETYNIVDEEGGEKLKQLLTEEEYDSLFSKRTPIKVKFKLWEMIKDFLNL